MYLSPIDLATGQEFYLIKFIYSEKATKYSEISTVDLSYVESVKSTVEISQHFVAFSEYMNFTKKLKIVTWLSKSICIEY